MTLEEPMADTETTEAVEAYVDRRKLEYALAREVELVDRVERLEDELESAGRMAVLVKEGHERSAVWHEADFQAAKGLLVAMREIVASSFTPWNIRDIAKDAIEAVPSESLAAKAAKELTA